MQPSPFTPGEVARDVPGRAIPLAEMDERLTYLVDLQRLVGRIRVDHAARGLGKTSLLRQVQRRAEARGALTVWVTAGGEAGLVGAVAAEIERRTADWRSDARRRLRDALAHLTVTVGVPGVAQVTVTGSRSDVPAVGVREFEDVIRATVAAAAKEGHRALVVFVDEIQSADAAGLRTVAYAWQHLQSEGADVPVAVFAAGLPNSPETIAAVVTFSERFAYRPLAPLDDDASALALVGPVRALGVEWEPGALTAAVGAAQGYPYSVQLLGDAVWSAAGRPDPGARLTSEHVTTALRSVRHDLDALFRARWAGATDAEQDFMQAMASAGPGGVPRSEIARRLGVGTRELSTIRARLLDKGLIEVVGHGLLAFSIPGFAEWVRETHGA